jgi:hypothetical protein
MLNHTVDSALGYLILSFLTWSVTFTVLVFGVILRRKILLWDEHWREKLEDSGTTVKVFAEELEITYEKIRATLRLLGFFLVIIVALMAFVVYLAMLQKPILGFPQVINSLWILALVALSALLPAFVNFAVGTYLTETMLLKANAFVYLEVKGEIVEKKTKLKIVEKAKQLKAQREALRAGAAPAAPAAPEAQNPAPAGK